MLLCNRLSKERRHQADKELKIVKGNPVPTKADLGGCKLWVDNRHGASPEDKDALDRLVHEWGMLPVLERHEATVFLHENPAQPGQRPDTVAMLVGGIIATPGLILRGHWPVIAFVPALNTARAVFISEGYKREHSDMCELIAATAAAYSGTKWRFIDDMEVACIRRMR